jgi:hypothetical protein
MGVVACGAEVVCGCFAVASPLIIKFLAIPAGSERWLETIFRALLRLGEALCPQGYENKGRPKYGKVKTQGQRS